MAKKEIRVALIGHKFMGVAHSNAFRNAGMWADLPVKLTMKCLCAEDTMENLQEFADKFGWESIELDWRKAVSREDIDLVSIATPNILHKQIAIEAAKQYHSRSPRNLVLRPACISPRRGDEAVATPVERPRPPAHTRHRHRGLRYLPHHRGDASRPR